MASIWDWSLTAADNSNADAGLTWAEGQNPGTVNASARMMMQRVAELLADLGGGVTASGSANTLLVTANSAFTTYANGRLVKFKAASNNTGAATLNVNSIGAKSIRKITIDGESALSADDIKAGGIYDATYNTALNSGAGGWLLSTPSALGAVPAGAGMDYWGVTAPTGWLLCYGQAVSRTTYAALFAAIGTAHGVGDGSTTFNLPDKRGRASAGKDDMGGSSANRLTSPINGDNLGAAGGSESHALVEGELAAHVHAISLTSGAGGGHNHRILAPANSDSSAFGLRNASSRGVGSPGGLGSTAYTDTDGASSVVIEAVANHTHSVSGNSASTGSGTAHNNMQPTIVCNYIIKI